ncbi:MAG: hypothetical protein QW836_09820, partial [Ignisphaera sp.]
NKACGSGSFLVRVARRMFKALGCKPDIAEFVEETLVGVDINPFAVEMAKLNLILAISDEMLNTCRASYVPSKIRVYWADSLAVVKTNKNVLGGVVQRVHVPSLAQIQGASSIPVPSLPGLNLEDLLDMVYRSIERNASFEDLLEDIKSKTDSTAVEKVKNELRELHSALKSIVESMGNSRIVEFVKNALVVASLIGKCNYVIGNPPWVRIRRVANPTAMIFCVSWMLKWLGEKHNIDSYIKASESINRAILEVLKEGTKLTPDLGGNSKTVEFTETVLEKIS